VLPLPGPSGDGRTLGRPWFPLVGLVLGGLAWLPDWGATRVATPLLGAVAAVALLAVVTGALHLDGLADAADGLLGGSTPERRLEIMRDSRVGSFGVVALILVLAGDIAALAGLTPSLALAALLMACAASRLALVAVIAWVPYVRATGLGVAARGGRPVVDLAVAALLAALPLLLDWRRGLLAAALVALSTLGVVLLARSRIGGATGDVYGAVVEVGQLAGLLGFAIRAW
jgi:adenosylcobinamide-GDP ribazoletransferase